MHDPPLQEASVGGVLRWEWHALAVDHLGRIDPKDVGP